ncbi:endopeptidase IV [Legionella sp. CNM-4043-24]|uniref:endopeptidase IV n=1 Tax=Legionella sp. CNM-4043-24 TaxID=3421646 RepID=UPI00403B06FD
MKTITKNSRNLALMLLLCSTSCNLIYAAEQENNNKNPIGCLDVGYQYDMHTLRLLPEDQGRSQSLYFLFNKTGQKVTLFQMRESDNSRSMYMNHQINPEQWGVLSTSEKQVKFICTVPEANSRYGKIVDCAESLRVCEYTKVKYGLNNRGNYWLVNSNTKNGAIGDVVRYGIIPGA